MQNEPEVPHSESSQKATTKICSLQMEKVGQPGNEGLGIVRVVEQAQIGQRGNKDQRSKDQRDEKSPYTFFDVFDTTPFL
jgi:hypothetical protein